MSNQSEKSFKARLKEGCVTFCRFVWRGVRGCLEAVGLYHEVKDVARVVAAKAPVVVTKVATTIKIGISKICTRISWSSLCALQSANLTAFAVALTIAGGISLILTVGVLSTALRT